MLLQAFSHPLAIVMPLAIWGILVAFMLAVSLALEDGLKRLRRLHQIPCHRCQYYTGSPYLKCPVHPIEALSEAAIDCRDYAQVMQPRCPRQAKPGLKVNVPLRLIPVLNFLMRKRPDPRKGQAI
ncbi:MAG: hypothetical protein ACFB0C_14255 [Leptolyngbyaceae cyanobacterium]